MEYRCFALVLFLSVTLSIEAYARGNEKVAVIFNNGNVGDRSEFETNEVQAKKLYESAGYKVIVLSNAPGANGAPTASELNENLGKLKGISELHVEFIGHGYVVQSGHALRVDQSSLDPARFPVQQLPKDILQTQSIGANFDDSGTTQFLILGDLDNPKSFVGIEDIRTAIRTAQNNNPNVITSVTSVNCYSGNISYGLQDLSNTQIYVGSNGATETPVFKQARDSFGMADFSKYFNKALASGESYQDAFIKAQDQVASAMVKESGHHILYGSPRSPMQESLRVWCEKNDKSKTDYATEAAFCSTCPNSSEKTSVNEISEAQKALTIQMAKEPSQKMLSFLRDSYEQSNCNPHSSEKLNSIRETQEKYITAFRVPAEAGIRSAIEQLKPEELAEIKKNIPASSPLGRALRSLDLNTGDSSKLRKELLEQLQKAKKRSLFSFSAFLKINPETYRQSYLSTLEKCGSASASAGPIETFKQGEIRIANISKCIGSENASSLVKADVARELLSSSSDRIGRAVKLADFECEKFRAKIVSYENDLLCANRFSEGASVSDWSKMNQLSMLALRSVTSRDIK